MRSRFNGSICPDTRNVARRPKPELVIWFSVWLAALSAVAPLQAEPAAGSQSAKGSAVTGEVTPTDRMLLTGRVRLMVQNSPLAGFRHAEAAEVWAEMRAGDPLSLVREAENAFDVNAVRVEWRGRKLGYVPRRENAALAWAMDRGERLHARISRAEWHPNPARRIAFEIFVE